MDLNYILTQEQREAGLSVYDDEDMVFLAQKGKILAVWLAKRVTQAAIRDEAQNTLLRKKTKPTYSQAIIPLDF